MDGSHRHGDYTGVSLLCELVERCLSQLLDSTPFAPAALKGTTPP
jgi:hypothetical protein